MTVIERWWQIRRADRRTHWSPDDPNALIAAGKAPAWEGAEIIGPYVPEADLRGAVKERDAYRAALEEIEGSPRAGIGSDQQATARAALARYREAVRRAPFPEF